MMILYWVALLALTTLLYVLLDGFDLGVGILFGLTNNEDARRKMLSAISPVWDGNETWLVFTGTILWGAFPRVYATLLSAFYLPIILMLGALILRGVAFEFRYKALGSRWFWDLGFSGGSLIAAFVQGTAVGALAKGLPMVDGHYAGGTFGWLSPFACLCGAGLCFGYALLGAGWLVLKCEGSLRDRAYALLRPLTIGVFGFLAVAFVYALALDLRIMDRWFERPYLLVFPAVGLAASILLARGITARHDRLPFFTTALIFLSAFGTLAVSFWPFMIPFSITIDQAASPPSSLWFMFWGEGLFVLPLVLIYTAGVYRVFGGKLVGGGYDEH
jgi:cytochrome bd ubiquinol oxidase subunit II